MIAAAFLPAMHPLLFAKERSRFFVGYAVFMQVRATFFCYANHVI